MKTNLKKIRESQKKLQEQVAKDLGLSLSTYRSWEQGQRNLNGEKLSILADYFNVSVDDIIRTSSENSTCLASKEQQLIDLYRQLNEMGQKKVVSYVEDLTGNVKYSLQPSMLGENVGISELEE